ncbi:nicotinate-nucleotide adenylyltransferase [Pelagibacterium lacus]|uniref:Probable nicotinate-nucleotide adenylyltransferase n=1 Tax=Pelagibacterium lacus TaxID=2282655 RepID=A0A369W6E6_9HYPH|nr:nicotinate-nucleotide adenylyltransferase [Pelagibacterium lacus]RDE09589.1 nicotinate-nucleotide adenylyltransferase [Pelagibacterium lacus]
MSTPLSIPGITDLPPSAPGMRIGLFGGSFNPPHAGHELVSRESLKRLRLDAVWWLVTPGNPLKDHGALAPLAERVTAARRLADHPRMRVTGFEAAHGFAYTYQTLSHLRRTLADRKFVWIMGADSLAGFHRWERWEEIFTLLPIAVYIRPGSTRRATFSKAATRFADYRLDETDAALLPDMPAPAWVFLHGLMSSLSSTDLRAGDRANP